MSTSRWDQLYAAASGQAGYFTTRQAAEAGFSAPLLTHHVQAGRLSRVQRGIYRLVHFPASEHEELMVAWLWSGREGVASHETALSLHHLSDALPDHVHLTLPTQQARRRLRPPRNVRLHFADLSKSDWSWAGPVPVTTPLRAVVDCALGGTQPDLVSQAVAQGLARGLFTVDGLREQGVSA